MRIIEEYRIEVGCQFKYIVLFETDNGELVKIKFDNTYDLYDFKKYIKPVIDDFTSPGLTTDDMDILTK